MIGSNKMKIIKSNVTLTYLFSIHGDAYLQTLTNTFLQRPFPFRVLQICRAVWSLITVITHGSMHVRVARVILQ